MYNEEKRTELTDLLYATISREIAGDERDINTALVDECYELLSKLGSTKTFTEDELDHISNHIVNKANNRKHKRKHLRLRLIAAIITLFILMGVAAYTFFDETEAEIEYLLETAEPGVHYSNERFDFETTDNVAIFESAKELANEIDTPVWLPTYVPKEFNLEVCSLSHFLEYDMAILYFEKSSERISFKIEIEAANVNLEQFNAQEKEYTSKHGHHFDFNYHQGYYQANALIDNNYYSIQAKDTVTILKIIESMIYVE